MNRKWFDVAFDEAQKAFINNEVPIGAVIVKDNKVLSSAFNTKEKDKCCISHAEILAIKKASEIVNNWRLEGCDIYVTLDPCPMCASAIKQARISNVFSAASSSDKKNFEIINSIFAKDIVNPQVNFVTDLDVNRSKDILSHFFKTKR